MPGKGRADRNGVASITIEKTHSARVGNVRAGRGVAEIQRARLLAAMTEICGERGGANVTVAHVVERAGVSRRTFYELFDDRDECFLAAFDDAIERAAAYAFERYDPSARWTERLRSALTGLLWFLDVESDAGWLLIVGSLGAGAGVLQARRRVLAQIVSVVDEGRAESKTDLGLSPMTAEGVVGAVFSVIHGRMIDSPRTVEADGPSLVELLNPLMSIVAMPYLGPAAARRELKRPIPEAMVRPVRVAGDPLRGLAMRITYRTVKVLVVLAQNPGSSNREIGEAAGIADQGQTSKLLRRLDRLGLVQNTGPGHRSGERNVWTLTPKGHEIQQAVATQRVG